MGKYFLFVKALNGKFDIVNEFVSLARDKISLEEYNISCTTGSGKNRSASLFQSPRMCVC